MFQVNSLSSTSHVSENDTSVIRELLLFTRVTLKVKVLRVKGHDGPNYSEQKQFKVLLTDHRPDWLVC